MGPHHHRCKTIRDYEYYVFVSVLRIIAPCPDSEFVRPAPIVSPIKPEPDGPHQEAGLCLPRTSTILSWWVAHEASERPSYPE